MFIFVKNFANSGGNEMRKKARCKVRSILKGRIKNRAEVKFGDPS